MRERVVTRAACRKCGLTVEVTYIMGVAASESGGSDLVTSVDGALLRHVGSHSRGYRGVCEGPVEYEYRREPVSE